MPSYYVDTRSVLKKNQQSVDNINFKTLRDRDFKKVKHDEVSETKERVEKAIRERKIPIPITRNGFKELCKALNIHCTELLSFEAVVHCRGEQMENGDPNDFDFERLINFVDYKSKFAAPADNPTQSLRTRSKSRPKGK